MRQYNDPRWQYWLILFQGKAVGGQPIWAVSSAQAIYRYQQKSGAGQLSVLSDNLTAVAVGKNKRAAEHEFVQHR